MNPYVVVLIIFFAILLIAYVCKRFNLNPFSGIIDNYSSSDYDYNHDNDDYDGDGDSDGGDGGD